MDGGKYMVNTAALKKGSTVIAFLIMVTFNILANLLLLNGISTGALSDRYPSLLTPASYTFQIWTIIYVLLFFYIIYQLGFVAGKGKLTPKGSDYIRYFFILSCLCNAGWIVAWHYNYIALSMMLILVILICLGIINRYTYSEELSLLEKIFIRLPFGIYFGWITVATVLNMTVLLTSIRWSVFGLSPSIWTITVTILILVITSLSILKYKNLAYAAAVIWAYIGILTKHTARLQLDGKYPAIIAVLLLCIVIIVSEMIYIIIKKRAS